MDEKQLVYLYCVTAQPPRMERIEDRPGECYLVHEAGLCAVVSRVAADQFELSNLRRNLEDLDWVAAETTKHERTVEAVMRDRCVIPFRFATLFHTDESLRTRLRAHGEEFQSLLGQLENKAEWGVKAYCDLERLGDDACAQDGPISDLNEAVRLAPPGRAFLLRKKWEELVKAALVGRVDRYVEQTVEAFQSVSSQVRLNRGLPPRTTDRCGTMILNAAFLVSNHDASAFVETANALNERYTEQNIVVQCSGPWPPYNFCNPARKVAHG